jgi:ribosomal protein L2
MCRRDLLMKEDRILVGARRTERGSEIKEHPHGGGDDRGVRKRYSTCSRVMFIRGKFTENFHLHV